MSEECVKSTMYQIPNTQVKLESLTIPFALICTPLKTI